MPGPLNQATASSASGSTFGDTSPGARGVASSGGAEHARGLHSRAARVALRRPPYDSGRRRPGAAGPSKRRRQAARRAAPADAAPAHFFAACDATQM
jgi:hypothetical protein